MNLCLDVGNTQIHGAVFDNNSNLFEFRKVTKNGFSSDELGIFLKSILTVNNISTDKITQFSVCSVVPRHSHSIANCSKKYFKINPFFLTSTNTRDIKIKYTNPEEVGADRLANAIGAKALYPNKDLIIIDFGTATTVDVINKTGEYLGGAILAGLKIQLESLTQKTAKLPSVEIKVSKDVMGSTTIQSIQSGLYWGHFGALKEIINQLINHKFSEEKVMILATGGLANLYKKTALYDEEVSDLVLQGLNKSAQENTKDLKL